mgnify:CR=1 FL=1|tara:strand:- start:155 stop:430 length:276 start_codon:yes stop_codon:yes gene_type:complete
MSEIKKLTEEEIKKVQDIRKNYITIQNAFGQLHLTKLNLEKQLQTIDENYNSLNNEYEQTQTAEKDLITSIQDKYGIGTLNIEDGTFTPNT